MNRSSKNKASFFVKVAVPVVIFGLFPVLISSLASNYERKASFLIESQNEFAQNAIGVKGSNYLNTNNSENTSDANSGAGTTQGNQEGSGELKVLTIEEAENISRIKELLIGKWFSLQEKTYTVDFLPNGTFSDKDSGKTVAYGTWSPFASATSSSNLQLDTSSNGVVDGASKSLSSFYIAKHHYEDTYKDQKFIYEIMQLDPERIILFYTGNSKILYFIKSTNMSAKVNTESEMTEGTTTKTDINTESTTTQSDSVN